MAQASSDLQRYVDLNPDALAYNLRQKRYEARSDMKCALIRPRLEDAANLFLGDCSQSFLFDGRQEESEDSSLAVTSLPTGEVNATVERHAFLAIMNSYRIRARYSSPLSGKEEWRWIRPHALGHNGIRWHLRAWCETNDRFDDFEINRIPEIEWSKQQAPLPQPDRDWNEWVTLRLRANRGLDKMSRQAVEFDYRMTGGELEIKVRRAMEPHLRQRLGLPQADGTTTTGLLELKR